MVRIWRWTPLRIDGKKRVQYRLLCTNRLRERDGNGVKIHVTESIVLVISGAEVETTPLLQNLC